MDVVRGEVESRGYRLGFLTWDDGPPLVLVSGVLQAAEDWVRVGYVDALRDFSVMAIDPLGFGASDKPHDPAAYRLDDRAVDVDAVLDAHGVSSALLWGYSFGASQVEAYARLRPARTRGVVMGGVVPGLNATDRRNVGAASIAAYESGDWETVWRDAAPLFPLTCARHLNDAMTSPRWLRRRVGVGRLTPPKVGRYRRRCCVTWGRASGSGGGAGHDDGAGHRVHRARRR
jgi:pimeloyl-ACP methyl ester carboxylesterase